MVYHKWVHSVDLKDPTPVLPHLEKGMMYGYRRDKRQRPIIIIHMRRIIESKIELEPLKAMANYFCQYLLNYGMIAGKVENWLAIYDLGGVGALELTGIKAKITGLVGAMQKNFRGRLYKFYGIDVAWMVRGLWKMAHRYVDDFTKRKLRIYANDY
jgi:hypothetical protein